jgi:hypothetical protein
MGCGVNSKNEFNVNYSTNKQTNKNEIFTVKMVGN